MTAGDCLHKRRCGITRRRTNSPPVRCNAMQRRPLTPPFGRNLRAVQPARTDRWVREYKPGGTGLSLRDYRGHLPEGAAMKLRSIAFATLLIFSGNLAFAQSGSPSGRGSATGDPAASSATPGTSPITGSSMKPSRSGSGTSTSGAAMPMATRAGTRCPTAVRA
jgi:hypothetical protein